MAAGLKAKKATAFKITKAQADGQTLLLALLSNNQDIFFAGKEILHKKIKMK